MRKRSYSLFWLLGSASMLVLGGASYMLVQNSTDGSSVRELTVLIGDIVVLSLALPMGILFYSVIPLNWHLTVAFWLSVAAYWQGRKTQSIWLLLIAYLASFSFGFYWPNVFWSLMSV